MNDAQDRLHTETMRVMLGKVPGHTLDQHHERNTKTGVHVQMQMSTGPCRVLLRMLGLDVTCKSPMFRRQ